MRSGIHKLLSVATILLLNISGCSVFVQTKPFPERNVLDGELEIKTIELGQEFTESFFNGNLELLWNVMTAEMHEAAGGSIDEFKEFRQKVYELAGDEIEIIDEEFFREENLNVYRRTSLFNKMKEPIVVQWGFGYNLEIADFFIRPSEPATYVVYRTKTELRLPFYNEWYVTAGGRMIEQNHHTLDYSNRFAYDMVSGREFDWSGPRDQNEDFETWGEPILAPAAGVIAMTRNDIPDNRPGDVNTEKNFSMGNFVSIDHGNGEFSILGHLQMGSIRVAVGDTILPGEIVGLAGNSGNSNGPHLHYNLQDRAEPNRGKGLPAQFTNILIDGHYYETYEPVRGQRVSNESELDSTEEILSFDYYQRLIFVNVSVNGSPDLFFLMDTGANRSAIDIKTSERLSLSELNPDSVEGSFGTIAVSVVQIDSIALGNAMIKDLSFTTYDLSGLMGPPGKQVEGILGTDFLQHFVATIDFEATEITLFNELKEHYSRSFPFEMDNGIPRVMATVNGHAETWFRYDSGSGLFETDDIYFNTTMPVFSTLLKANPDLQPVTHFSGSGIGGTVRLPVYQIETVEIGDHVIQQPYLIVQPEQGYFARPDAVGFFGNNFLEKFNQVVIDFKSGKIYFNK